MIETKTAEEIPSALEKIAKAFTEVMNENQELQRQLEIAQLEAKDNLDHANVIRHEYAQLKDAADEMVEDLIKQSEFLDGYPESLEKYKSIIKK